MLTPEQILELRGKFEWRAHASDDPLQVDGIAREATMGVGGWWIVWHPRGMWEGYWARDERDLRKLTPIDEPAKAILEFVRGQLPAEAST